MGTLAHKKILIIGSGVMGTRFAAILSKLGCQVSFYKYFRSQDIPKNYPTSDSLSALGSFDGSFICSPTATHKQYLKHCLNAGLNVFIEKPIADSLKGLAPILKKRKKDQVLMVGFNLRTLPAIQKLKTLMPQLGNIQYAHFDIGQYLPSWRPGKDYRRFYSAKYERGGGVALDLIHELDLALSLFPGMKLAAVKSEKLSTLDISVEDYVEFQFTEPRVRITLDYLSHVKTRRYQIVGTSGTLVCDAINQKLEMVRADGSQQIFSDPSLFDRELSFEREIEQFLSLVEKKEPVQYNERDLGIDALRYALKARKQYV